MQRWSGHGSRRRWLALLAAIGLHLCAVVVMERQQVASRPREATPQVAWSSTTASPSQPITLEVRSARAPVPPAQATPSSPASSSTAAARSSSSSSSSSSSDPGIVGASAAVAPAPSSSPGASSSSASDGARGDLAPRPENLANLPPGYGDPADRSLARLVRGVGGDAERGPGQSVGSLRAALDFQTDEDADFGTSGAALAAKKATRALRADIAFHDVTVGMASDWFREMGKSAERGFRPTPSDLDNPAEVAQAAIMSNFLKDPSSWDEEAQQVLGPMLRATSLHSQDPVKRLALGNSANLGASSDSQLRATTVKDLLMRKEAGLSVRFAFEVDVHHDGEGQITAIHVLRKETERALQEKIRLAIDDAVRTAAPAPALINEGRPFRSRWLFAATWFIDPPGCLLTPSDAFGAAPGQLGVGCGGSFDITGEGVKTSSLDVQQKVSAQLLRITPLGPRDQQPWAAPAR